jgi:helicase
MDKDEDHPNKPYFDVACFELTKDDNNEIRYRETPFFIGLILLEEDPQKGNLIPFKFWKIKQNKSSEVVNVDPTTFRLFILNAKFVVIGNHLNIPQGYELDQYQIVESEIHPVQKVQMLDYLKKLEPVYEYCSSIQYKNIRNFLFCHSCKQDKKYTLIDENTKYKNHAFYVCKNCAGKEIVRTLKKTMKISPAIKMYLRDLLNKYNDVVKVLNVFGPNFDILKHREATLVGVKKKKISDKSDEKRKKQTIYDFNLPNLLKIYYKNQKKEQLLPAQIMALEHGLLENQDELVVSATSSGKTMIGELTGISKILTNKMALIAKKSKSSPTFNINNELQNLSVEQQDYIKQLLKTQSKSKMLYIVPIVALANMRNREYKEFKKIGINSVLKVGISHISKRKKSIRESGRFQNADIIVGTYEAIDIILRTGRPHLLKDVRTIVIDEIQMLADSERGLILDGLIGRLRLYLPKAQMLYLSATISDPKELASHLRATLINYTDRPVPIEQHLVMNPDGDGAKLKNMRNLVRSEFKIKSSYGFRGQSIVFTNSRKNTERLAEYLRENHIPSLAYHGGLDHSQRKYVEKFFEKQKIACVVTTAALAAGVDFPASMVIFYNLSMGIQELTVADFEQMSGRAGRLKKHDLGKVYMLVNPGKSSAGSQSDTEDQLAIRLLKGKIEPLKLNPNEGAQFSEILAVVAMFSSSGRNNNGILKNDLEYYHSMLYNGDFDLGQAIIYLKKNKLIDIIRNKSVVRATRFGKAVAESFFSLKSAIKIQKTLIAPVSEEIPAPDMLELAQSLETFNNVYVTNRFLSELSLKGNQQVKSNNLFSSSVLSMIGSEHLGKKKRTHLSRRLFSVIIRWSEDIFNCICKDKPYCDCGKESIERFIVDYRLSGLSVTEIVLELEEEYEIRIFKGDIIDYLESIINNLFSIQKIGRSVIIPAQTMLRVKDIHNIVNDLIGTKKK